MTVVIDSILAPQALSGRWNLAKSGNPAGNLAETGFGLTGQMQDLLEPESKSSTSLSGSELVWI